MKKVINVLVLSIIAIIVSSCVSTREIPIHTIEKVIYKDTLIYIHDSIKVPVPYETTQKEVYCTDTSYLKTSLAESIAYIDTTSKRIHHTLTQNGELETTYDTIVKIEYMDKIVLQDVPVEVEVIKYKRDALFWCLLAWAVLCLCIAGIKLFIFR